LDSFTFKANDGSLDSNVGIVDITVTPSQTNSAPALTLPGAQTAFEDNDLAIGGVRVADAEGGTLTVHLSVGHGTLTLVAAGGTVTGNGPGSVTLVGGSDGMNDVLAALVSRGVLNYSGTDGLCVTADDGNLSTPGSVALTVVSADQLLAELRARVDAL